MLGGPGCSSLGTDAEASSTGSVFTVASSIIIASCAAAAAFVSAFAAAFASAFAAGLATLLEFAVLAGMLDASKVHGSKSGRSGSRTRRALRTLCRLQLPVGQQVVMQVTWARLQ